MSEGEIITRRRKWSPAQKSALLDEVESEGGKVAVVARRRGVSESLLYNWRSAWKAAACAVSAPEPARPRRRIEELHLPDGICGAACCTSADGCGVECRSSPNGPGPPHTLRTGRAVGRFPVVAEMARMFSVSPPTVSRIVAAQVQGEDGRN